MGGSVSTRPFPSSTLPCRSSSPWPTEPSHPERLSAYMHLDSRASSALTLPLHGQEQEQEFGGAAKKLGDVTTMNLTMLQGPNPQP